MDSTMISGVLGAFFGIGLAYGAYKTINFAWNRYNDLGLDDAPFSETLVKAIKPSAFIALYVGAGVICFFLVKNWLYDSVGKTQLATGLDVAGVAIEGTINGVGSAAKWTFGAGADVVSAASEFTLENKSLDPNNINALIEQKSLLRTGGNADGSGYAAPQTVTQPEPESAAPAANEQLVTVEEAKQELQAMAVQQGPASVTNATVMPGDTLFAIAKRVYGNGEMWPALLKANPALGNGDVIYAGTNLVVPPADYAANVTVAEALPSNTFNNSTARAAYTNSPAYGPSANPLPTPITYAQSESGSLVQHSSGWGVEVVTKP